jgi:hypothetical protein
MGAWGWLSQLAEVTSGDLDDSHDAYVLPTGLLAAPASTRNCTYYAVEECFQDFEGGLFAMPGPQGCWRCGDAGHHRRNCPHKASQAELAGAPINQWAKIPRPPLSPSRAAGVVPGATQLRMALPSPQTSAAQIADYATKADIEQILARINAITPAPTMPSAPLAPASCAVGGAATSIAQMATSMPPPAPSPPLIVGGSQTEGYVYVGRNHGLTIWGSMDTVASSMMEAGAAGNDVGM